MQLPRVPSVLLLLQRHLPPAAAPPSDLCGRPPRGRPLGRIARRHNDPALSCRLLFDPRGYVLALAHLLAFSGEEQPDKQPVVINDLGGASKETLEP